MGKRYTGQIILEKFEIENPEAKWMLYLNKLTKNSNFRLYYRQEMSSEYMPVRIKEDFDFFDEEKNLLVEIRGKKIKFRHQGSSFGNSFNCSSSENCFPSLPFSLPRENCSANEDEPSSGVTDCRNPLPLALWRAGYQDSTEYQDLTVDVPLRLRFPTSGINMSTCNQPYETTTSLTYDTFGFNTGQDIAFFKADLNLHLFLTVASVTEGPLTVDLTITLEKIVSNPVTESSIEETVFTQTVSLVSGNSVHLYPNLRIISTSHPLISFRLTYTAVLESGETYDGDTSCRILEKTLQLSHYDYE